MAFVNIHGQPIAVPESSEKKAKSTSSKPKLEVYHKGWIVTGHSPEQVADYKAKLPAGEAFNQLIFARRTKFRKVRTKPYESNEAAQQCAKMAEKEGWLNVEVKPQSKGEK
ncbi:hypothetical protein D3C87_1465370 [compost metagenome]